MCKILEALSQRTFILVIFYSLFFSQFLSFLRLLQGAKRLIFAIYGSELSCWWVNVEFSKSSSLNKLRPLNTTKYFLCKPYSGVVLGICSGCVSFYSNKETSNLSSPMVSIRKAGAQSKLGQIQSSCVIHWPYFEIKQKEFKFILYWARWLHPSLLAASHCLKLGSL